MTKKIAFILESFGTGGVTEVVKNIFSSLKTQPFKIELILLSKSQNEHIPSNIKHKYFDIEEDHDYSLVRYIKYALFRKITKKKYKEVINYINRLNPDIIHFHTSPRQLMLGHCLNDRLKSKLIYTDHSLRISQNESTRIKRRILGFAYKAYYKYFNITAVSKSVYDNHILYNLIDKNKQHDLIENKIRPIEPSNNNKSSKIRFIYVARFHPSKGHDILVRAWESLDSKVERELVLIGANNIGLKSKDPSIKFLGDLPKDEVAQWLNKSNYGIFPSKKEGLPLALIEMLSAKLPVIVNDIPELTSIVKDGFNGYVYAINDEQELSQKIKLILNQGDENTIFSTNAKSSVSNYCSNEPGKEYLDLYKDIISRYN